MKACGTRTDKHAFVDCYSFNQSLGPLYMYKLFDVSVGFVCVLFVQIVFLKQTSRQTRVVINLNSIKYYR